MPGSDGPAQGQRKKPPFRTIAIAAAAVVVLIMAGILIGKLVFGIRAGKARATRELDQIGQALKEYYAEYGTYPPADSMQYEYESTSNQSEWFRTVFLPKNNDPNWRDFFTDMDRTNWPSPGREGWHLNYKYGLCSYLYLRDRGENVHWYWRDTFRDSEAKKRWQHLIADLPVFELSGAYMAPTSVGATVWYTNRIMTLRDPWGEEYRYVSPPPYSRYRLWSPGRDRVDGTSDDIHRDSESD